jgi:hypothetical protein
MSEQVVSSLKPVIVLEYKSYVPVVIPLEPVLTLGNISNEEVIMPAPMKESLEEVALSITHGVSFVFF